MGNFHGKNGCELNVTSDVLLAKPRFKKVVLLNDDYTSMHFVTNLLMNVFDKSMSDANSIMMHIHNNGEGVCGIYPYDIAELKYSIASGIIISSQEPLRIVLRDA